MFGYFRFHNYNATYSMKKCYKNYYCGTCFALQYNYGQRARMLLSYDIALLAILISAHIEPECEQLPCFGCKNSKVQFKKDNWNKIAATNILLFSSKLDDDINDENSFKAKLAKVAFKGVINKARIDYPQLAEIIDNGYINIANKEKSGCDVLEMCDEFSMMMGNIAAIIFNVNDNGLEYIRSIAGWLYFIDQLDDYDKDIKKNKYNALALPGINKEQYINRHITTISNYLKKLMSNFEKVKADMDIATTEYRILYSIINDTIPSVTFRVLSDIELPKLLHRKKHMEWRES